MSNQQSLTPEQLAAIRERLAAATAGPWQSNQPDTYWVTAPDPEMMSGYDLICHAESSGYDAEFIAHARQDVPALLEERDRLARKLEQAFWLLDQIDDEIGPHAGYSFQASLVAWLQENAPEIGQQR